MKTIVVLSANERKSFHFQIRGSIESMDPRYTVTEKIRPS